MTPDLSIIALVLGASMPVQIVLMLLVMASLVSWSIIFTKRRMLRRTKDASDDFEHNFWSGGDLNTLYRSATRDRAGNVGMASIFESGFREFNRAMQQGDINADKVVEECRRAMHVAQMREVDRLEQNLATLATIGSTSLPNTALRPFSPFSSNRMLSLKEPDSSSWVSQSSSIDFL